MLEGPIYLDSNIFIAAFGEDAQEALSVPLQSMFEAASAAQQPVFLTSELTLTETLIRAFRTNDESSVARFEQILLSSNWLLIEMVSRPVLITAARLQAKFKHLKTPDAIHLATAFEANCPHLLTGDGGIRERYEVHGQTSFKGSSAVSIVRPNQSSIDDIITWLRS